MGEWRRKRRRECGRQGRKEAKERGEKPVELGAPVVSHDLALLRTCVGSGVRRFSSHLGVMHEDVEGELEQICRGFA